MNPSERNKTLVSFLTKHGDIDILIEFKKTPSLFEVVRIEQEISDIIGKKVELITEKSLSPYIKDSVLKEVVILYEEKRG